MSGIDRKTIRAAVRAALTGDAFFAGYATGPAWSQPTDSSELPHFAIYTPIEPQRRHSHGVNECALTLLCIIKLIGGDLIEDDLDDAADAATALILGACRSDYAQCELINTGIKIDGAGAQRVGTLDLTFTVTYWVNDPSTP